MRSRLSILHGPLRPGALFVALVAGCGGAPAASPPRSGTPVNGGTGGSTQTPEGDSGGAPVPGDASTPAGGGDGSVGGSGGIAVKPDAAAGDAAPPADAAAEADASAADASPPGAPGEGRILFELKDPLPGMVASHPSGDISWFDDPTEGRVVRFRALDNPADPKERAETENAAGTVQER